MPKPELVLSVLDFARIAVNEIVQSGEDAETCAGQGQVQTTNKHSRLSKAALGWDAISYELLIVCFVLSKLLIEAEI